MRLIKTLLFVLCICPLNAQIGMIGNTHKICDFSDSTFVKLDTFPSDLEAFDVIMIFSNSTSFIQDEQLNKLITFLKNGGGLYIGAENYPLQAEANQVTRKLYNKETYGSFNSELAEVSEDSGNLKLNEIDSVPSGKSTVAFPLDYRLSVDLWVGDAPLLLSGSYQSGRIVLDGGYSRFYCDQNNSQSDQVFLKILNYLLHEENEMIVPQKEK